MVNCRYCATPCPEQGEHDHYLTCELYTEHKTTNEECIRVMITIEDLAEFGVCECIPAECTTSAWYGHFKGSANTKAEAIQREMDWLTQSARPTQEK